MKSNKTPQLRTPGGSRPSHGLKTYQSFCVNPRKWGKGFCVSFWVFGWVHPHCSLSFSMCFFYFFCVGFVMSFLGCPPYNRLLFALNRPMVAIPNLKGPKQALRLQREFTLNVNSMNMQVIHRACLAGHRLMPCCWNYWHIKCLDSRESVFYGFPIWTLQPFWVCLSLTHEPSRKQLCSGVQPTSNRSHPSLSNTWQPTNLTGIHTTEALWSKETCTNIRNSSSAVGNQ